MKTIVFDIEVAGFDWEEVDEITRGYLLTRARDEADRKSVPDRTALFPGLGKIIAIGMWLYEDERGLLLLEGESEAEKDWEKVPHSKVMRGSEPELLERFWKIVGRGGLRVVTFNGRGYDGPMLMIRSAQHGLSPSMNLCGYRYDMSTHVDLMEVFNFQGSVRESYKLDYWCRRFDIESPKGGLDGSQVSRAYREGRIDEIGEYCLRDVRATAQLYGRVKDTLLPLFGRR
ncbi:MAG: 3'-5' exonuclease [Planctomycetota bacterium]|nr:MAG: 3'-5' exonuclease [Planctomycetota bacterium]